MRQNFHHLKERPFEELLCTVKKLDWRAVFKSLFSDTGFVEVQIDLLSENVSSTLNVPF